MILEGHYLTVFDVYRAEASLSLQWTKLGQFNICSANDPKQWLQSRENNSKHDSDRSTNQKKSYDVSPWPISCSATTSSTQSGLTKKNYGLMTSKFLCNSLSREPWYRRTNLTGLMVKCAILEVQLYDDSIMLN